MKFAVSVPDPMFRKAETLAKRMGLSRSAVITRALEAYNPDTATESLTEAANRFADEMTEEMCEEQQMWIRSGSRTAVKHTKW